MKITLDIPDETMENLARYHLAQCVTAATITKARTDSAVVKRLVSDELNRDRLLLADSILHSICTAIGDNEAYVKLLDKAGDRVADLVEDAGEMEA